jgi:hypothetical protein
MFDPTFFYLAYLSLFLFDNFLFLSISNVDKSCPSQINYALLLGDVQHSPEKSVICLSFFPDYLYLFHFFPFPKFSVTLSRFLFLYHPSWVPSPFPVQRFFTFLVPLRVLVPLFVLLSVPYFCFLIPVSYSQIPIRSSLFPFMCSPILWVPCSQFFVHSSLFTVSYSQFPLPYSRFPVYTVH